jgi:hypothetical protein
MPNRSGIKSLHLSQTLPMYLCHNHCRGRRSQHSLDLRRRVVGKEYLSHNPDRIVVGTAHWIHRRPGTTRLVVVCMVAGLHNERRSWSINLESVSCPLHTLLHHVRYCTCQQPTRSTLRSNRCRQLDTVEIHSLLHPLALPGIRHGGRCQAPRRICKCQWLS